MMRVSRLASAGLPILAALGTLCLALSYIQGQEPGIHIGRLLFNRFKPGLPFLPNPIAFDHCQVLFIQEVRDCIPALGFHHQQLIQTGILFARGIAQYFELTTLIIQALAQSGHFS